MNRKNKKDMVTTKKIKQWKKFLTVSVPLLFDCLFLFGYIFCFLFWHVWSLWRNENSKKTNCIWRKKFKKYHFAFSLCLVQFFCEKCQKKIIKFIQKSNFGLLISNLVFKGKSLKAPKLNIPEITENQLLIFEFSTNFLFVYKQVGYKFKSY